MAQINWRGEEIDAKLRAIVARRVQAAGIFLRNKIREHLSVDNPYEMVTRVRKTRKDG